MDPEPSPEELDLYRRAIREEPSTQPHDRTEEGRALLARAIAQLSRELGEPVRAPAWLLARPLPEAVAAWAAEHRRMAEAGEI